MVHFDLDPSDVLVGDFDTDDGQVGLIPILKIADLGLSEFLEPLFDDNQSNLRRQGKRHSEMLPPN